MKKSDTLVIIPTLDESRNIANMLEKLAHQINSTGLPVDILLVDDSLDMDTVLAAEIASRTHSLNLYTLRDRKIRNIAHAYFDGYRWAMNQKYKYYVQSDADGQHRVEDIFKLLKILLEESFDFVIGSRYVQGGNTIGWSWSRKLISKLANFYFSLFCGFKINDATTGLRGGSILAINDIFLDPPKSKKFTIHAECTARILKSSFTFTEFAITFLPRTHGISKMTYGSAFESLKLFPQFGFYRKNIDPHIS